MARSSRSGPVRVGPQGSSLRQPRTPPTSTKVRAKRWKGDVGALLSRQAPVELDVLLALHLPGEVLGHSVLHEGAPGLLVRVGAERQVEGPGEAVGREVLEDEAGAAACGLVPGLDGVGE